MGSSYADTLASYDALVNTGDAQQLLARGKEIAPVTARLPDGTPVYKAAQPQPSGNKKPGLLCYDSVAYEEAQFLIKPYIPLGKITIVQGDSGTGKTAFICKLAAEVSQGGGILASTCLSGNTLLLSVEDDPSTLRGRIEAGGGNVSRCFFIENAWDYTLSSPELENAIRDNNIKLLVFDPLQAFFGANVDMHRANETRPVLSHLAGMAKRNGCAILLVSHLNKGLSGTKSIYRALGSVDIVAAARSVLYLGRNPNDESQCVACHIKSSNAKPGQAFAFRIGDRGGVCWDGYVSITADDLQMASARKEKGIAFEDDPAVIAVTRLYEENPKGVFVSYEQLGNYAIKMMGFPPCLSGKDWRAKLSDIAMELLQKNQISIQFVNLRTAEHTELGKTIAPTGAKERGILIQKHMPASAFQVPLGTMNHTQIISSQTSLSSNTSQKEQMGRMGQ